MKYPIRINSIFDGQSPARYYGKEGTYLNSIAIDPDYPISSSDIEPSGFAVPIGYSVFSSGTVNAAPVAIINTPKTTLTYVVLNNGKLISYNSSLAGETLIGTVTGNEAHGGIYYNNYIYIFGTGASHNDVSRYGPLDGSASLTNGVWTGATLGSQAVISDTTYPTLRSVEMPNHWAHVHGDGALYFLDYESKSGGSAPGQGLVHKIKTSKTTNEGDTNNGSAYNALDLPLGFYPTTITNVNTNILITGILSTDNNINQGTAAFIQWDPTDTVSFFLGPIPMGDPLVTASLNVNGHVFVWSGNAQNGVKLSSYGGGNSMSDLLIQSEGLPPMAGAVASNGSRISWGGFTTIPSATASVFGYGSKDPRLPVGLHNIAKASSAGATPIVTAIKYVQQDSFVQPKLVIGWNDASGSGLDKYATDATLANKLRWMFNVGQRFQISKIRIPFGGAVNSTTSVVPAIYLDDSATAVTPALTTINNTNYSGKRKVIYKGEHLKGYVGENSFIFELTWSSTNPLPIGFPILIEIDILEDETN